MPETVIVALLSLIGTLGGAYFASKKTTSLIVYRLEQPEQKVEMHNQVVERTYEVEKKLAGRKDPQQEFDERLGNLERDAQPACAKQCTGANN